MAGCGIVRNVELHRQATPTDLCGVSRLVELTLELSLLRSLDDHEELANAAGNASSPRLR